MKQGHEKKREVSIRTLEKGTSEDNRIKKTKERKKMRKSIKKVTHKNNIEAA